MNGKRIFTTSPFAAAREIAQCYEDIGERDAEIERLKDLLTRAADALESTEPEVNARTLWILLLITELRKAAE